MQQINQQQFETNGASDVLRLTVRNHPGVMSHVCGLFARRAFNLEGILCLPEAGGSQSVMLLAIAGNGRLEQIIRQLRKLEDVVDVEPHAAGRTAFALAAMAMK
ncbi:MAG TPA: ACT domain-containing protein [Candidatus Acidoferrales bacterium]|nr:ACT domain-containing protein [Candidatus Acidoferrales bacterium]